MGRPTSFPSPYWDEPQTFTPSLERAISSGAPYSVQLDAGTEVFLFDPENQNLPLRGPTTWFARLPAFLSSRISTRHEEWKMEAGY